MNGLTPMRRVKGKIRQFKGVLPENISGMASKLMKLVENGWYRFSFSLQEKRIMRRRKKIKPSLWAPRHLKIPYGRYKGAYMNMKMRPHLVGIMDAYVLPFIRKIAISAVPQSGKTTLSLIWFSWTAVFEPGPALTVYPNETTGEENMKERFQEAFNISPQLRRLKTGRKEDVSKHALRLQNCWHRIGWSGSTTSASNRSVRYLNLDEVNKYQEKPDKNEASIFSLFQIRVRDYANHKVSVMSSPSDEKGFITIELERETEAVFVYWVRCPHCGSEQLMDFTPKSFWWPKGNDGHSLDRKEILSKSLARYICQGDGCGAMWDDDDRNRAIQTQIWRLRTKDGKPGEELFRYLHRHRPRSIGFEIPSWILWTVSLSEMAHDYLKGKDKKLSPEERFEATQNFANKHRGRPWRYEIKKLPVEKLKKLCDDRPEGSVPGGNRVAALIGAVDTQDDSFYISIWAFGYGFTNDQWLVKKKHVFSFGEVAEIMWDHEYYDADGKRYFVELVLQDMLGHRTKEVIEFCLKYEGLIIPTFGSSRAMSQPYSFSQKEYTPGTDQPLPGGGIRALKINTKYYKDHLAVKLNAGFDTPGSVRLYNDCDEDFRRQLLSEVRDEKGNWVNIAGRDNHYWDDWVIVNCGADYLGVKHRRRPEETETAEKESDSVVVADSSFMGG